MVGGSAARPAPCSVPSRLAALPGAVPSQRSVRTRAVGRAHPEPEPEPEVGETRAAGGGHGDEPGLADAAPSQSGGPRGKPGRARVDRSHQLGPVPAALRRARSPLGLTWGLRGRGLNLAPPPGAHRAEGGQLRGPW